MGRIGLDQFSARLSPKWSCKEAHASWLLNTFQSHGEVDKHGPFGPSQRLSFKLKVTERVWFWRSVVLLLLI